MARVVKTCDMIQVNKSSAENDNQSDVRAKLEAPSPAPTCTSIKSEQSMDHFIGFQKSLSQNRGASPVSSYFSMASSQSMHHRMNEGNTRAKLEAPSPAPTCISFKSEQSKDQFIGFNNGRAKLEAPSPAPTCISFKSEQSKDQFIGFQGSFFQDRLPSPGPSDGYGRNTQPMDRQGFPQADMHRGASPCTSANSDGSIGRKCSRRIFSRCFASPTLGLSVGETSTFRSRIKQETSSPASFSFTSESPQCRKRFTDYPELNLNLALDGLLKQPGFSRAPPQNYAGPEEMACDICSGKKLRAVKLCLTCSVAYCETHVRQHYTVEALQRHILTDVTEDLVKTTCQLHHRALEYFCKTDQQLICLDCVMQRHNGHDTLLINVGNHEAYLHKILFCFKECRMEISDLYKHIEELTAKNKNLERAESELSHLSKRFCRGLKDPTDFTSEFVEVAALGRHVNLGMLYDCRSDSFRSDVILWEKNLISSMKLLIPRPQTDLRVLEKDTLQERLAALDLSVSLRASVVSGLVEMTGASAFINHPFQSELQDRITLHYRTSTSLDMISHDLLDHGFPLSVTDMTTATHVVVAVLYGSQAFFVLDKKKDRTVETVENAQLKDIVKKIISSSRQTDLISRLTEYHCAAYIDGDVLQSHLDSTVHNAGVVPLKVWLYPLKNLHQTSACTVKDISEDQLCKAEEFLEKVKMDLNFCQHLMVVDGGHEIFTRFPALKEALSEFCSLLQQFHSNFQRRLATCIKTIRETGADEEEKKLRDLLDRNNHSPFSPQCRHQWLQNKLSQIRALIQCKAANVDILNSQDDLQRFVQDHQADRVLCFSFTSLEGEDLFLSTLKQNSVSVNMTLTKETQQVFMISDTSQKILSGLPLFMLNKKINERTQETVFIAASVPDEHFSDFAIRLYQSGHLVSQNVQLHIKPDPPEMIAVQQTRVTMRLQSWKSSQTTEPYRVEYRTVSEDRSPVETKWRVIPCSEENCVVTGLVPGTRYEVRYALMDSNGMSDCSSITQFQTASRHRPGPPTVLKPNKESLYIAWQRAESDEDSPVLCYKVEYLDAGLEGWQSIQTDGPVCECTINLPHSNCYKFRVSAVYGNGDISTPSEETEIPVHVWKINLSKRKASLLLELLKLQTVMKPVEITGWTDAKIEIQSLFQCLRYTTQLSLSSDVMVKMVHNMGTIETSGPVTLRELSIVERSTQLPNEAASRIQSSLASLLQLWTIECLDLTEYKMEAQSYTVLINQQAPLFIRFSEETLKKLVVMVYEARDEELTRCFLQKVDGDLISCSLAWEVIHYFLQYRTVTVDFRRSTIKDENICDLLPLLNRLKLRRLNFNFFLSVMKEICKTVSVQFVSSLLGLAENCIKLDNRMLNSVDCAALRFTLEHSMSISLNLLCASIPEGELESIVPLLSHVSHLRVDRLLLVRLLHCCSAPDLQKETSNLLTALHHKLDFSCQDSVDLTADTTTYILCAEDCKVICMAIQEAHEKICLILHDCEIEEAGVKQLFPILDTVTLQCSDALLHKLLPSVPVEAELKSKAQRDGMDLGPGAVDN